MWTPQIASILGMAPLKHVKTPDITWPLTFPGLYVPSTNIQRHVSFISWQSWTIIVMTVVIMVIYSDTLFRLELFTLNGRKSCSEMCFHYQVTSVNVTGIRKYSRRWGRLVVRFNAWLYGWVWATRGSSDRALVTDRQGISEQPRLLTQPSSLAAIRAGPACLQPWVWADLSQNLGIYSFKPNMIVMCSYMKTTVDRENFWGAFCN